jgi:histidine triad (HIT) family protein
VCVFCSIVAGEESAEIVFEDERTMAFLDVRPLFPGHSLLIPKEHHETLGDLPGALVPVLFTNAQFLSRAVEGGMEAQGTFLAINNKVSQSVPHLHVHIVPRRKKDGLRGFFWPRHRYTSAEEMTRAGDAVRGAVAALQDEER